MRNSVGASTDVGRVREGNEDSYLVDAPLFVVADGMGGHLGGEVASATAIEIIEKAAEEDADRIPDALARFVKEANRAIYEKASSDPQLQGMGTTCTLVYVDGRSAHIAHVGDSRAYLFRDDQLRQLTEDHTLVERMVREGRLAREEAAHHPQRSIITRALGVDAKVEVDVHTEQLQPGDRLLLCSDGLSSMLDESRMGDILRERNDSQATADRLVAAANEAGGEDNITVILLDIGIEDASQAAATVDRPEETEHREDTEPSKEEAPPVRATDVDMVSRPPWRRKLIVGLVALVVLAVGAYAAIRYSLDNSWFVGADDDGTVAIYNGIPEKIAGLSLSEVEEESRLRLADLPQHLQDNVEEGIKVDSIEEARETVADLEERSEEFGGGGSAAGGDNK